MNPWNSIKAENYFQIQSNLQRSWKDPLSTNPSKALSEIQL